MNMRRDLQERPEILGRTNWKSWKNEIEKRARKEGVWKYCNPDDPGEYYPELHQPGKPHVSTVRPEATSLVDLGEDDFIELSSIVDQYWKQMRAYEDIQTKLQMAVLSAKFKKSRLEDLQPRWEGVQELANKADVQKLFKAWNALFTDCNGYLSGSARSQDAETAGDLPENWLPLTSQHWIETPDDVGSRSYGDDCAQPRSPTEQESVNSLDWIETPDDPGSRNYRDDCAQLRSRARRGSIASRYRTGYHDPAVSTMRTSLSPQPGSVAGQSEETPGDNSEIMGLSQRSIFPPAKEAKPNCNHLDEW
ncbi:unnamed protein product [Penicillium egyptiacum]|uniref:Uncharacterized protein n=1 Tax=Penicillium egyptiacum TaxID=1303716 RepID=A0A9W4KK93_9EURO|nr:unnamed protein product [Penicillium egyptiacum]